MRHASMLPQRHGHDVLKIVGLVFQQEMLQQRLDVQNLVIFDFVRIIAAVKLKII